MKKMINQLISDCRLEASLPNSYNFRRKKADEFNANIDKMALKIYEAYLPKGKEIAEERAEIYRQNNYRIASDF